MFRYLTSRSLLRTSGNASIATSVFSSPALASTVRFQSDDNEGSSNKPAQQKDLSVEAVWSLWNEGNLFSLSAGDLSQFLSTQSVNVDAAWKKAALVRQVEDVLRAREAKRKQQKTDGVTTSTTTGAATATASGGQQQKQGGVSDDVYGKWEGQQGGAASKSEMLLDLSASGFYSQNAADTTAAAVPKAFQLFSGSSSPDLILSRVNTTSFPGFAANAECFTFTGADAAQSTKSRYSKTTQWSILNARHLRLSAEIAADLGKLILRNDIVKKNRYVVSSFALQQRVQHTPNMWVSTTSNKAVEGSNCAIERVLKGQGFSIPTNKAVTFEAKIRRKSDVIAAELNEKGGVSGLFSAYTNIQTAYWVAPQAVGQDVRFLVRSRRPIEGEAAAEYLASPILDVASDEAKSLLKPNLGEIIYASENMSRTFTKKLEAYTINVVECSRQPLIISREEEDGVRTEVTVSVLVPMLTAPADKFDLNAATSAIYDLATELAKEFNSDFVSQFNLNADPVVTSMASA